MFFFATYYTCPTLEHFSACRRFKDESSAAAPSWYKGMILCMPGFSKIDSFNMDDVARRKASHFSFLQFFRGLKILQAIKPACSSPSFSARRKAQGFPPKNVRSNSSNSKSGAMATKHALLQSATSSPGRWGSHFCSAGNPIHLGLDSWAQRSRSRHQAPAGCIKVLIFIEEC